MVISFFECSQCFYWLIVINITTLHQDQYYHFESENCVLLVCFVSICCLHATVCVESENGVLLVCYISICCLHVTVCVESENGVLPVYSISV